MSTVLNVRMSTLRNVYMNTDLNVRMYVWVAFPCKKFVRASNELNDTLRCSTVKGSLTSSRFLRVYRSLSTSPRSRGGGTKSEFPK